MIREVAAEENDLAAEAPRNNREQRDMSNTLDDRALDSGVPTYAVSTHGLTKRYGDDDGARRASTCAFPKAPCTCCSAPTAPEKAPRSSCC